MLGDPPPTSSSASPASADDIELVRLRARCAHLEQLAACLARASAGGAELVADIDEKNSELHRLNRSLATANARSADLMALLAERTAELEQALAEVRTLQGVLPICMHCHRIRETSDAWSRLEDYVEQHSHAKFSHALCVACLEKHYPETP